MKAINLIVKIVAALAAIAGIVYIVATYGDKIVAWAKKLLGCCPCNGECECFEEAEVAAEEPAAEEAVAEEEPAAEEAAAEEPVAAESDFEG